MIETKKQTEKTKEDYITIVSKTITDFEKKLEAIDNAIKVCDNEALKSAYEEEKEKMQTELSNLKKKREDELDKTISVSNNNNLLNDATMTMLKNISELSLSDIDKVSNDDIKNELKELTDAEITMLRNISNLDFGGFDTLSNDSLREVIPTLTDSEITMLRNISDLHLGSLDNVDDETIKSVAPSLDDENVSKIRNISDLKLNDFNSLTEGNIKSLLPTLNDAEITMLKTISELKLGSLTSTFKNNEYINDNTLKMVENISKLSNEKNGMNTQSLNDSELQLLKNITLFASNENPKIDISLNKMESEISDDSVNKVIEKLKQEINTENLTPAFDEINVSKISLPNEEIKKDIDLNSNTIDIASIISESNIDNGKMIVDTNFVPADQIGDIFRSSSIMPTVYDKLDSYIEKNKEEM